MSVWGGSKLIIIYISDTRVARLKCFEATLDKFPILEFCEHDIILVLVLADYLVGPGKTSGLNQFTLDDYFCIWMRCICIIGLLPNAQMLQIGTDKNQVSSLPSLFSPYSYLILKIQNFTQCHSEAVKHSKIQTIPFGPFLDFRNESQKMSKDQIIQIT